MTDYTPEDRSTEDPLGPLGKAVQRSADIREHGEQVAEQVEAERQQEAERGQDVGSNDANTPG